MMMHKRLTALVIFDPDEPFQVIPLRYGPGVVLRVHEDVTTRECELVTMKTLLSLQSPMPEEVKLWLDATEGEEKS